MNGEKVGHNKSGQEQYNSAAIRWKMHDPLSHPQNDFQDSECRPCVLTLEKPMLRTLGKPVSWIWLFCTLLLFKYHESIKLFIKGINSDKAAIPQIRRSVSQQQVSSSGTLLRHLSNCTFASLPNDSTRNSVSESNSKNLSTRPEWPPPPPPCRVPHIGGSKDRNTSSVLHRPRYDDFSNDAVATNYTPHMERSCSRVGMSPIPSLKTNPSRRHSMIDQKFRNSRNGHELSETAATFRARNLIKQNSVDGIITVGSQRVQDPERCPCTTATEKGMLNTLGAFKYCSRILYLKLEAVV